MNILEKQLEHPSVGSQKGAELEVLEVGSEIAAGPKLNQAIAAALELSSVPDFCAWADHALECLELRGVQAYIKPTTGRKWVCIFDHAGMVAVTTPQKTQAAAAAVALHFVITEDKSSVT